MMTEAEIKEIKTSLIGWIADLSDVEILNTLESIRLSLSDKDWWDKLGEGQRQVLNERLKNVENVTFHSSEVFWHQIKNG